MKNVLKNFLKNGTYNFDDAQERIDYAVAKGKVTASEAEELLKTARQNAKEKTVAERVEEVEKKLEESAIDYGKLNLFLASITEDEKPEEREGYNLVQRYNPKKHCIVWDYVEIEENLRTEKPIDNEDKGEPLS